MTTNPYTFQHNVLRMISMLDYKKIKGYAAYGLSFKPTEECYKPYLDFTYETNLSSYPYVVILDESLAISDIIALLAMSANYVTRPSNTAGTTLPAWKSTAIKWLAIHNIPYTLCVIRTPTTDINKLLASSKDVYIPTNYKNFKTCYDAIVVKREHVKPLQLTNVPHTISDSEYTIYVRKQVTRAAEIAEGLDTRTFKCCTYVLHKHRRDLLKSIVTQCVLKTPDDNKWMEINDMLIHEEEWLAEHESWNDSKLYETMAAVTR